MNFDDHYHPGKDKLIDGSLTDEITKVEYTKFLIIGQYDTSKFKLISINEAKELIEELSHSYITSEVVKNLLSQLQDFVTENELTQRTNSPT